MSVPDVLAATMSLPSRFVPAFSGLLSPHWRSDARGVIVGLSHSTTRAHICRALLEAMAHQTADVVGAMEADAQVEVPVRTHGLLAGCTCLASGERMRVGVFVGFVGFQHVRVDGGVSKSPLLLQLLADVTGKAVHRPANIETTAVGAALAAAVGVGHFAGTRVTLQSCNAVYNTR